MATPLVWASMVEGEVGDGFGVIEWDLGLRLGSQLGVCANYTNSRVSLFKASYSLSALRIRLMICSVLGRIGGLSQEVSATSSLDFGESDKCISTDPPPISQSSIVCATPPSRPAAGDGSVIINS